MRTKLNRLAIFSLIALVIVVGLFLTQGPSFAQILERPANQEPPTVELVRALQIEVSTLIEQEGFAFLVSTHFLENISDLVAYRELQNQRLQDLEGSDPRLAMVTFKLPLSLESVEQILADLNIVSLRYVSAPEGGGQLPHPIDEEAFSTLRQWEERLRGRFGEDFQILAGFTAAEVAAPPARLREIAADHRVAVVDPGPTDLLDQIQDAIAFSENDTAFEYEAFVGSVCTLEDLIVLTDTFRDVSLIDNAGIHNSLRSELENARRQLSRGRANATVNLVEAFIHEVEAQRDKHIEAEAADQLTIIADCVAVRIAFSENDA